MPDFTTIFPAETITEIISCLEQKDCVECMSVCHQWYNIIPNYIHSTEVWRKLTIAPDSWNKTNNAMIQCLGPHVKKVSIYSQDSCTILEQLDKHHCGIKSLGNSFIC
ncbi:hypothetical protein BDA99DRAFT_204694 [Phascolomyces articulosus]|uniref:F-box domain-containing protein n=1 Tax=Phascolomyces articulosus TaxID=60185 RepID=A0AAD5P9I1_9FUNG|nr:hypothetical protein BDA99DRAFT_204694 [Phascolomyces articulosus]